MALVNHLVDVDNYLLWPNQWIYQCYCYSLISSTYTGRYIPRYMIYHTNAISCVSTLSKLSVGQVDFWRLNAREPDRTRALPIEGRGVRTPKFNTDWPLNILKLAIITIFLCKYDTGAPFELLQVMSGDIWWCLVCNPTYSYLKAPHLGGVHKGMQSPPNRQHLPPMGKALGRTEERKCERAVFGTSRRVGKPARLLLAWNAWQRMMGSAGKKDMGPWLDWRMFDEIGVLYIRRYWKTTRKSETGLNNFDKKINCWVFIN